MSSGEVRLRYSGFILFLSRLFSVGTGLLFSLMITRNIPAEEYGVYGNLGDVLSYFTLLSGIFPFWTARFAARKYSGSSKTGLTANLLISLPCALTYIVALPTIMSAFQIDEKYLIIYAIITVEMLELYLLTAFESILQAKRPQAVGFGFLIFELCKVVLGFVLIMQLRLGLFGVIISVISAYLFQILFYLRSTLPEFHEKVKRNYVKKWLKASPFNLYGIAGQQIVSFYLILLFVHGGRLSRAYYGAAMAIAGIIGYSSLLGYALYPRLLSKDRPEDIHTSLRMVLMFAIPMTAGAVVLSASYLAILNEIYRVAEMVLILLSIDVLSVSLSSIFNTVVTGTEKLDIQAKISYGDLIRSRLFILTTLPYIQAAVVLPLTYSILNFVVNDAVEQAVYIALLVLVADVAMMTVRYRIAKKSLHFNVPWSHVCKYLGASAVMALILYLLPPPARLSITLAETLLGGVIYFVVLSAVDNETKLIVKSAKKELLKMLRIS
jgi:O-antigen/teichoic acid export membrane protein